MTAIAMEQSQIAASMLTDEAVPGGNRYANTLQNAYPPSLHCVKSNACLPNAASDKDDPSPSCSIANVPSQGGIFICQCT